MNKDTAQLGNKIGYGVLVLHDLGDILVEYFGSSVLE
mgnify:FL=1